MISKPIRTKVSLPVLIVLAVNFGLTISYILLWYIAVKDGYLWAADFTAFYTGASIVRDGQGDQLYNLDTQVSKQELIVQGQRYGDNILLFVNPPHSVLLFIPFAFLSLHNSYFLWSFLQLLTIILCAVILLRLTKHWSSLERWLLLSTCFALPGLFRSFILGALSTFMLLCLLYWYSSIINGKDRFAGDWLFISTIKPQITLGPGLICLIGRRWKAITNFLVIGTILFIITTVLLGWDIWWKFLELLSRSGNFFNAYGIDPTRMYNLRGTLSLWGNNIHPDLINKMSLGGFILCLIFTAYLWRGEWDYYRPTFLLRTSLTLFLNTFLSLHVYLQDSILLTLPGLLFYEYLRRRNLPRKTFAIIILCCPALFFLDEFFLSDWLPIHLAVVFMVVMIVWSGILLHRESKTSQALF